MSTVTTPAPPATATFWRYLTRRFPIGQYPIYVTLFSAGLLGVLRPPGPRWAPTGADWLRWALGAATLLVVLFFMRTVDEIKDLAYDRVFQPDRPLVTGELTVATMRGYLAGSAVVALALSAPVHPGLVGTAAAIMAYSLLLVWFERISPAFAAGMFRNIAVAIQLKTGLLLYVVLLGTTIGITGDVVTSTLAVTAFLAAYLHWEIARKTIRARYARPGERLYSTVIGTGGSLSLATGLLVAACVLVAVVDARRDVPAGFTAALLLPLALTGAAVADFLRRRDRRSAPGALTLVGYLLFLLVLAVRLTLDTAGTS